MAISLKETVSKKFKVGIHAGVKQNFSAWTQSATTDKYFRSFFFIWIIPLLLISLFVIINYASLPNEIPLFYSRLWGDPQLAIKILIFLPLGGTLLLGVFNLSLAISFHSKDKILSYFLAGSASLVSLLSAITVFNIVNLMR